MLRRQRGALLIEQLVVVGVVGVAIPALLTAVATSSIGLNTSTEKDQAVNLAVTQMEFVKNHPFVAAPATYPLGVSVPSGYSVTTVAELVSGADANVQRVLVVVSRASKPRTQIEGLKVNRP
jgi:type II secretory pathway pseudopilin PulG